MNLPWQLMGELAQLRQQQLRAEAAAIRLGRDARRAARAARNARRAAARPQPPSPRLG